MLRDYKSLFKSQNLVVNRFVRDDFCRTVLHIHENSWKKIVPGNSDSIRRFYRGNITGRPIDVAETWLAKTSTMSHKPDHLFYAATLLSPPIGRYFFFTVNDDVDIDVEVGEEIGTCVLRRERCGSTFELWPPYHTVRQRRVRNPLLCQGLWKVGER